MNNYINYHMQKEVDNKINKCNSDIQRSTVAAYITMNDLPHNFGLNNEYKLVRFGGECEYFKNNNIK